MKKVIKSFFAFLLMVSIVSCNKNPSSTSIEEVEVYNKYEEKADEFHLNSWIGAPFEAFEHVSFCCGNCKFGFCAASVDTEYKRFGV